MSFGTLFYIYNQGYWGTIAPILNLVDRGVFLRLEGMQLGGGLGSHLRLLWLTSVSPSLLFTAANLV
jgi:hypothetical protein